MCKVLGVPFLTPKNESRNCPRNGFEKDDVFEKFLMRFKILGPTKLYSEDFLGVQYCV